MIVVASFLLTQCPPFFLREFGIFGFPGSGYWLGHSSPAVTSPGAVPTVFSVKLTLHGDRMAAGTSIHLQIDDFIDSLAWPWPGPNIHSFWLGSGGGLDYCRNDSGLNEESPELKGRNHASRNCW